MELALSNNKLFLRSCARVLLAAFNALVLTTTVVGLVNTSHADFRTPHSALVSENASFFTPGAVDGRVEAIAIDGDRVFVGGTFTQIQEAFDGDIIDQPYLFAFSRSTGEIIRDFDPILNNAVFALQTTGENSGIFVGGAFTMLNGEINRRGLVKINDLGDRVLGFGARPDKRVFTMDRSGNTLYIGGNFESISSQPRELLAAIDTVTGEVLPSVDLDFEGVFSSELFDGTPSVDDIEVTSDGELMVVVGNFETINGISRPRLSLLEIGDQTVPSTWNTDIFDVQCPGIRFPQYIRGIDIAPDDSYFVVATNGFRFRGVPACDSTTKFDLDNLANTTAQPAWVNYTGGDSVYEVAATEYAVYVGGHFEFLNNDRGSGNDRGPGGVPRNGLAALDPLNGLPILDWRSDRNPRGVGTFSLEVQTEGLYIGDDTDFLNNFEHPKLKFLPVTNNTIPRPGTPTLPTTILRLNDDMLDASQFDGSALSLPSTISNAGWVNARGAVFLGGQLFHADSEGRLWVSSLNDNDDELPSFAGRQQVDLLGLDLELQDVGPDDNFDLTRLSRLDFQPWKLDQLTGMFFDYDKGRLYYTLENNSQLLWRAFTPSGPLFGDTEHVADYQGDILWSDVRGMDAIGGHLYFGRSNGNLYRAQLSGSSAPLAGTTELVSTAGTNGLDWNRPFLAFSSTGGVITPPSDAQFEFEFAASSVLRSFRTFEFPMQAGEPLNVRLTWDDPNAQLNVFLRDPSGTLLDSDNDLEGSSPKWLSAPTAEVSGLYTVSVKIRQGSTAYQVSINPDEQPPPPPERVADFQFDTSGSENAASFQTFDFAFVQGEAIDVRLTWDDPDAQLNIFLRDSNGLLLDSDSGTGSSPKWLSATADVTGVYTVAVKIKQGATNYTVSINPFDEEPPAPTADFEFSASGSTEAGSFQTFEFMVDPDVPVNVRLAWNNPDAQLNVFMRDANGQLVDLDNNQNGSSPKWLFGPAGAGGAYRVSVKIQQGVADYTISVNPFDEAPPVQPEPRADFEFNASGNADTAAWRSFKFNADAGELVEVSVLWDNPAANVLVFLRDETGTQVDRNADAGASPRIVSAVAETSGLWSVGVRIESGDTAYDLLVDTSATMEEVPPAN